VADVDRGAPDDLDGNGLDLGEEIGAGVEHDGKLVGADLRGPGGHDDVLLPDGGVQVPRRQAPGEEPLGVDVDHDQALLAAVRIRDLNAPDGGHVGADE